VLRGQIQRPPAYAARDDLKFPDANMQMLTGSLGHMSAESRPTGGPRPDLFLLAEVFRRTVRRTHAKGSQAYRGQWTERAAEGRVCGCCVVWFVVRQSLRNEALCGRHKGPSTERALSDKLLLQLLLFLTSLWKMATCVFTGHPA
jgi:hypothetical protein